VWNAWEYVAETDAEGGEDEDEAEPMDENKEVEVEVEACLCAVGPTREPARLVRDHRRDTTLEKRALGGISEEEEEEEGEREVVEVVED
jgi:hypothetical protein